jgi:hypothetical protein
MGGRKRKNYHNIYKSLKALPTTVSSSKLFLRDIGLVFSGTASMPFDAMSW